MIIVYMGTPDFAIPPLRRLLDEGYRIPLVVSQPDRPKNRGKKILPTPVKIQAEEYGVPVLQPDKNMDSEQLYNQLAEIEPDIIVVAAYGKLLSKKILDLPKLGCINIHASLLPRHRGAAPIQHAILSGDKETGVTLMYMSEGMDEGDMIAKKHTPIGKKTSGDLSNELSLLGADLLIETLPQIIAGTAKRTIQDNELATYAPKIGKEDGKINFQTGAAFIERQIRAMSPSPGAYTFMDGKIMKVFSADIKDKSTDSKGIPGQVTRVDNEGILVVTADEDLLITRIQMPGKQALNVSEYIRGNKIEIDTVLG